MATTQELLEAISQIDSETIERDLAKKVEMLQNLREMVGLQERQVAALRALKDLIEKLPKPPQPTEKLPRSPKPLAEQVKQVKQSLPDRIWAWFADRGSNDLVRAEVVAVALGVDEAEVTRVLKLHPDKYRRFHVTGRPVYGAIR